jgi:hypothetical protein
MRNAIARWSSTTLQRLHLLGPVLVVASALIVAACKNGSGGSGY